jgi:hypothetical protein
LSTRFRQGEVALPAWVRAALVGAAFLAAIGLPLNTLEKFWAALACGLILLASATKPEPWRYAAAAVLALAALALKAALPHTQVEIAHNVYLPTSSERYRALPAEFRSALDAAFLRANPRSGWCDPQEELRRRGLSGNRPLTTAETGFRIMHCWQNAILPDRPFAFEGDAFFLRPPESRVADRLAIDGPADARLSAAYSFDVAWYFWRENENRIAPVWYLAIKLPQSLIGSRLCSRGQVYWESENVWSTPGGEACREVGAVHVGTRIWALDAGPDPTLKLRLDRSRALVGLDLALRAVLAAALAGLAWLTLELNWPRLGRAAAWCAASAVFVASAAPAFFTQPLTVATDHDALIYRGLGYDIAQAVAQGHWMDALRGGEDVFYFMPGMRYFRAVELILFGDTSFATLLVAGLLLPVLWHLALRVLDGHRGLAFFYVLACTPILARLTSLAAKGYGEAAGFLALISGLGLFLGTGRPEEGPTTARATALWAAFALVSIGAWIRPNFALVVGVLALIFLRMLAPGFRWRVSALVLSASLLVFAAVLHNLYFGDRLVWFVLTVRGESLRVDLADYAGMLGEWLSGSLGVHGIRVAHQLYGWVLPLRWLVLLAAFYLLLRRGPGWPPARLVAAVCLALYVPFLFYFSVTRHIQTADALGALCVLAVALEAFTAWRARFTAGRPQPIAAVSPSSWGLHDAFRRVAGGRRAKAGSTRPPEAGGG